MPDNRTNEIRTAPSDSYLQLRDVADHIEAVRKELATVAQDYRRLRANPAALAVDTLGDPIDPAIATDAVLHGLARADSELDGADRWLSTVRSKFASRLKLTDTAAEDLERRQTQPARPQRSR